MGMGFEQLRKFNTGERYCESNQYGTVWFTVKSDPVVYMDDELEKVEFVGELDNGEEVKYLMTKGLEHYGPQIDNFPAYENISEWKEY